MISELLLFSPRRHDEKMRSCRETNPPEDTVRKKRSRIKALADEKIYYI